MNHPALYCTVAFQRISHQIFGWEREAAAMPMHLLTEASDVTDVSPITSKQSSASSFIKQARPLSWDCTAAALFNRDLVV